MTAGNTGAEEGILPSMIEQVEVAAEELYGSRCCDAAKIND
jgi:hypothetical protein